MMDQAEFEALKTTFPWTERTLTTRTGGIVQIIDCNGAEVPLFSMTRFLEMITQKLAGRPAEQKEEAA